jgi:EAL domain-containing protein (putative c-di-GMP-specific phosphodiesterase class I)
LSYLRRFPFDTLKIDRSFIKDVPEEEDAAKLVSAIISMADVLGLKIVPEGVENQQQLDFISARNCHLTQGFFLAKPMLGEKMALLMSPTKRRPQSLSMPEHSRQPMRQCAAAYLHIMFRKRGQAAALHPF